MKEIKGVARAAFRKDPDTLAGWGWRSKQRN